MFSFKYVATILLSLFLLYEIFLIFIFSFTSNLSKLITCCCSELVILTFASTIGFLVVCDFTSTVTFLLVSTSKSDSQGVKNVSSAITSNVCYQ